jgi:dipeptidyl aminopeptidase/acylaminoacyl peptidase
MKEGDPMGRSAFLHRPAAMLAVVFFVCSLSIAQNRLITPEIVVGIKTITDARISPDGKSIVFQSTRQRRTDEKPGSQWSELWMVSLGGRQPYRFAFSEKSDRVPRWSPDGKSVAFLSTRGETDKAQLYLIPVDGGEARQLTNSGQSISGFKWSPDGRTIAYTMQDAKTKEEESAEKEGRDWIVADANFKHTRLFVIDVATKENRLVTTSDITVWDFDWSPDGKRFVLAATETPRTDDSYMFVKLMIVEATGGDAKLVTKTEGKLSSPRWSPDGKLIAYLGATAMNDPSAGNIFVVSPGGGTPENLTKGYTGTATSLDWIPKSNMLVFVGLEGTRTILNMIKPSEKRLMPLSSQDIVIGQPSFSGDGTKYAVTGNSWRHPNEVWAGDVAKKELTRITTFNPELEHLTLGEQEVVKWKTADGWEIEGILVKPVGYQQGQRYPTVLQIHGGPESAYTNGWNVGYANWAQLLAANGYAVLMPNYRGSTGRGVDFSMADHRDLMGKEFEDMVAGAEYLIARGIADPDRFGIGGGSYGGYTSAWAATSTNRFKAAVVFAGITNWYSMTGTSDIFWENSLVHWDAIMYENMELYLNRSPIAYIKNASTPTLILHGEKDLRVPIGQGQELYTGLKWKGVPTEFVTYPREPHGLLERAHQLDCMNRVLNWFNKYLKKKETTG